MYLQFELVIRKYFPTSHSSHAVVSAYTAKIVAHEATLPTAAAAAADADATAVDGKVGGGAMDTSDDQEGVDAELEAQAAEGKDKDTDTPPTTVLPEVEVFVLTLLLTTFLRYNLLADATSAATALIQRVSSFNRRSLDVLASKAYYYFSYTFERVGRLADVRPILLKLYRTSCVRHDEMGQAVLLNLILRNFLHYNMIDQARLLSSRAGDFPESASNNQFCRFLYYMARIQVVQLEYADAYKRLLWAARKAPQDTAVGFSRSVLKLTIIVQLLMGEIPERAVFNAVEHRHALVAYLELTKAVRAGDLGAFNVVMGKHSGVFTADGNLSLIRRLGHNVVKIGLRKISVSYSRISFADISRKLMLPTVQGSEYICAKAIRDGVIDATIDHANSCLLSNEAMDMYSTSEPQKAFHARIGFCMDVYSDAIKGMRYPGDAYRPDKKSLDDKIEDQKTIEELLADLEDEDGDD
jgi:26S proteasome regulatory subunit N3